MRLYTPDEPAPWINTAEEIFRQQGAGGFPCEDNEEYPQRWLREFPLGSWALEHSIEPGMYVAEVYKHFSFLEQCGVAIPSLEMQATNRSFSEPSFEHALYVSAAHVGNSRYPDTIGSPEPKRVMRELAGSLHTYVDWVHGSPQKLALFDVLLLTQYLYGELEPGAKRLYLVDVEPALGATQAAGGRTFQKWQERVEDLKVWSARGQAGHEKDSK